jgi:hypothetical protein
MMTTESIQNICEMRMLVGFLGEKQQACWWGSSFLSSSSKTFLKPIYPNSIALAQYSGVCRAASIVHDERIGIGRHYHLYRLPDSMERALMKCIQDDKFSEHLSTILVTTERVMDRLMELGIDSVDEASGPIPVGDYTDRKLDKLLKKARSHYVQAMKSETQTFPYMRCV